MWVFLIGYVIGGITGLVFMSVLQMSRENEEKEGDDDSTGRKL